MESKRQTWYYNRLCSKSEKKDGIQCFHAVQSFVKGEITPERAHEIGMKLAEELWGDKFQVIVTTHLNTDNLHNHFVRAPIRGKVIPY